MDTKAAPAQSPAALEALYEDPLRPSTARAGRAVVIASLVAISVAMFGAKLTSSSAIPISFEDRPEVLPSMLFSILALLTLNFALKAWTDWLRDKEVRLQITRFIEDQRTRAAIEEAHRINAEIMAQEPIREWEQDPHLEEWEEQAEKVEQAAIERVKQMEESLGLRSVPQNLRLTRILLEIHVPIVLGALGMVLSARQAWLGVMG